MSNYTIQNNDNLWKIAKREYGLTNDKDIASKVKELAKANNLSNPNTIFTGKTITLVEKEDKAIVAGEAKNSTPKDETAKDGVNKEETNSAVDKANSYAEWDINRHGKDSQDVKAFEVTDEKGLDILKKLNNLISQGDKADENALEAADKEGTDYYKQSILNVAQKDIEKYYDKNNDGKISEEEYVEGKIKQLKDSAAAEKVANTKAKAKEQFLALNFNNNDGLNVIDKTEYASYLWAIDANNSTELADGRITKKEADDASASLDKDNVYDYKLFTYKMSLLHSIFGRN